MSSCTLQPSPILCLPAELREQIYAAVLLAPNSDINLLGVCRQIYAESYPLLFKRPLTFSSQSSLSKWLGLVQFEHLHNVFAITLYLQDIDLTPILSLAPLPGILCWELYEQELSGITLALRQLPGLRNLSIARWTPHQLQSHLYRSFLHAFCALLPHCNPNLTHLTLHESIQRFSFLLSLPHLRSIRLVGFGDHHTAHAFTVLAQLPSLAEVELVTEDVSHAARPYGQHHLLNSDEKALAAALATLPPLTAFSIQESAARPSVLTPSLLTALGEAHGASLRILRMFVASTPSFPTLARLHGLLRAEGCGVEELELRWPDVEAEILESLLPRGLRILRVRVEGYVHAFDLLWGVIQRRRECRALERVGLVGEWEGWEEDEEGQEVEGGGCEGFEAAKNELELAIGELRYLGVGTLKGVERGVD
ncbi:uncharacterized protein BDZ99DRAFT_554322 [Mytilinidion resinicola]|uniref:F-box domain-containing protein n=1 Tax=Mytilinidion resinicola TaxID=574789 RepID=A0A6A6Z1G8_9PEZI|nr:uncharacterized protein BDZ99DRAFT_554322 [Mytilinidion resinicola]KAF2814077.1 hypothetical protein BDZ99DRAFT_554322 [Mytilinidion resinicola]